MCNTRSVNNLELIFLQYKRPMNYLTSKLAIGHQPFYRLLVSIQSELGAIKIRLEMYDNPYNSKTFPLVWRIVAFNLVVTLGCIGNNIFLAFLIKFVATLTLGLQPKQGLGRVRAKREAQESHLMLSGMKESVKEQTLTLLNELPFWELESRRTFESLESNYKGQNPLDWKDLYIIRNLLEHRCLKWARMTHLDI